MTEPESRPIPRGHCPDCGATGPLAVDRRGGIPRPVVFACRCAVPPEPVPSE